MNRIKEARLMKGWSQQKLADKIGVARSTIAMWENESSQPDNHSLVNLSICLNKTIDFLLGNENLEENVLAPSVPGAKWIPILGSVPAGIPIEAIEDILDYEEITPQMAAQGEHFALKIKGHSMEPKISDGDVVIVRKQDDAESGEVCVVMVNGDEATVKRIKKRPEGLMLIPNNPAFEPMFYSNEDISSLPVRILGRVVELRAKL